MKRSIVILALLASLILAFLLFARLNASTEDMMKYLKDTEQLAQDGKNPEALTRFIWLYNHALEHDPAFYAVRLSFLLGAWKDLADKYPPALKALQEVRDREAELLRSGKGTFDTFHEVVSINEVLMEEKKSIELFVFIDEKYPALAKHCWNVIDSKVIAAKKFDLVKKYEPDLMKKFNEIVLDYKENVLSYEKSENLKSYKKFNENTLVHEVLDLIIIAKEAMKDEKMAEEIREKAFEILPDSRLKQ